MPGALDGIRILEFSEMIAAPLGGMLLSDLGADVIKVEPPGGEQWRLSGQFTPRMEGGPVESRQFISLNRGKRGIALNLKTPEGREVVYRLVPSVDVVIINYRPDTPGNLGIDYDTLRAINPRIVYVQNTAFGSLGPAAHRPGYDLVAQAMTGLMAAQGRVAETGLPLAAASTPADISTGLVLAWAVCAGLFARERTGEGQKIEASLMGTALAIQTGGFTSFDMTPFVAEGALTGRAAMRASALPEDATFIQRQQARYEMSRAPRAGANVYYRCYLTKDSAVAVACLTDALRKKFNDAVAVPDPRTAEDAPARLSPEFAALGQKWVADVEARIQELTTAEWLEIFDKAGVPSGPYHTLGELFDDPQVVANEYVVSLDHSVVGEVKMVGPVIKMSRTPTAATMPSPGLGQHTDEVLGELGYSADEVAALHERGAVH